MEDGMHHASTRNDKSFLACCHIRVVHSTSARSFSSYRRPANACWKILPTSARPCPAQRSSYSRSAVASNKRPRVGGQRVAQRLQMSAAAPSTSTAEATEASFAAEKESIKVDREEELPTNESSPELLKIRHTSAHVMAMAVQKLFPGTQVTIGPWIDNG